MRQVMSHDEHKKPDTILPGCKVLLLDEAHSGHRTDSGSHIAKD